MWKLYVRGNKYRIGKPAKFLWLNYVTWYYTNIIRNYSTHVETHHSPPVIFETENLNYARKELCELRNFEAEEKEKTAGNWIEME